METLRCPNCGSARLARGEENLWCRSCGYFAIPFHEEDSDREKLELEKKQLINQEEYIRVPLTKGTYLILTHEEYRRGIARGKNERRRLANEARLGKVPTAGSERAAGKKASISFPYSPGSP